MTDPHDADPLDPRMSLDSLKEKESLRIAEELDSLAGKLRSIVWENTSPGRPLHAIHDIEAQHKAAYDKGVEDATRKWMARSDATRADECIAELESALEAAQAENAKLLEELGVLTSANLLEKLAGARRIRRGELQAQGSQETDEP